MNHRPEMLCNAYYISYQDFIDRLDKNLRDAHEIEQYAMCISCCNSFLEEKDFKETYRDYKNSTKEASTSFGMLIKEKMEANAALNSKKEEDNSS